MPNDASKPSAPDAARLPHGLFVRGFEECRLDHLQARRGIGLTKVGYRGTGSLELHKQIPDDVHSLAVCLDVQRNLVTHEGRTVRSGLMPMGCVTNEHPGESSRIVLQAPGDAILFMLPRAQIEAICQEADVPFRSGAIEFRTPPLVTDPYMLGLGRQAETELADLTSFARLRVETMAQDAIVHMLRHHSNLVEALAPAVARSRSRGGLAPAQLRRAMEAMDSLAAEEVTLEALATAAGCSASHFSRAFKQSTGLAPFAWLLRRRIERAKELLLRKDLPLAQIGLEIGFAAQPQFTTAFRRVTGTTPAAWRRMHDA